MNRAGDTSAFQHCWARGDLGIPAGLYCAMYAKVGAWKCGAPGLPTHVGVIAWLLKELLEASGLIEPVTLQELCDRLVPGGSGSLQTLLQRPHMGHSTATWPHSRTLVRKLAGVAPLKGEDILLQASPEAPLRYHRLRMSIPAKLWRRIISGWKWTGAAEHINVLEARATFTTLCWRAEHLKQMDQRCVHLVDSIVVLHYLIRGRSSSRKMRRTVMRIGSLLLATGIQRLWGYVSTHQNPADKPSCWAVKKNG